MNQNNQSKPDPQVYIEAMLQLMQSGMAQWLPMMAMPPLPAAELARKIVELQTVDLWLTQQQTALRAVLAALQAQQPTDIDQQNRAADTDANSAAGDDPAMAWWNTLQQQFIRTAAGFQPVVTTAQKKPRHQPDKPD